MSIFRSQFCPKPYSYTLHGLSPCAGTYVEECISHYYKIWKSRNVLILKYKINGTATVYFSFMPTICERTARAPVWRTIRAVDDCSAFAQAYLGSAPRRMLLMPQQARCSIWPCIRFG